jgi:hypothetical protein
MKYRPLQTDFEALQRELTHADDPRSTQDDEADEEDDRPGDWPADRENGTG